MTVEWAWVWCFALITLCIVLCTLISSRSELQRAKWRNDELRARIHKADEMNDKLIDALGE